MFFPAINDTIIAVSSGWQASPLGIVRLSGPDAGRLVAAIGLPPSSPECGSSGPPLMADGTVCIGEGLSSPATAYWFKAPRSYTGQDLVELHVPGCLPLLRELCARLIEHGARRALPGEFTARAYLAGKLSIEQVEDVLATISTDRDSEQRQERRAQRQQLEHRLAAVRDELARLLALIEAGIDFAEEEDVRFLSASELRKALERLSGELTDCRCDPAPGARLAQPHVAIVGLPNAGKSTLFNALLGHERAIVSPILGTTRDVLSAEVTLDGVQVVLQDCAGFGRSADEIELAAHLAAERNVGRADLIIWVQACGVAWPSEAERVLVDLPPQRRILVLSKSDLASGPVAKSDLPGGFAALLRVSAATGEGLATLRREIVRRISSIPIPPALIGSSIVLAAAAIQRARAICGAAAGSPPSDPEAAAGGLPREADASEERGCHAQAERGHARHDGLCGGQVLHDGLYDGHAPHGGHARGPLGGAWAWHPCSASEAEVLEYPELISLELRTAYDELAGSAHGELVERVLGRVFREFCVGK